MTLADTVAVQVKEPQHLGSIAARLMEQLYYKPDTLTHGGHGARGTGHGSSWAGRCWDMLGMSLPQ